ncbi:polysaccharide deacetylase family protein [Natrialbaceae archaeon A-gly3]
MTNRNRRSFVSAVGTAGLLGLSGCLSVTERLSGDEGSTPSGGTEGADSEGDALEDLPGESIGDFEDLDAWTSMLAGGDLEAETDDPYAGSQSARLTADEDADYAGIYRTFPGGTDLSERNFSAAVQFTGHDQLQVTLEVLAPNSRNTLTMRRTLTGPTDRWVRVDFGVTRADTVPDLTDVREIRLTARRRGDSGPVDCRIDDLRAVERPERGRVTFLFDGTLESHYTRALEHMNAYGYAGVEAVIPEAVGDGGRLTIDQLEELADAGWDAVARPRTGSRDIHDFPPEEQEGMIRRTRTYLENRGFEDGATHFVTPRNVLGPETMDLVREYHDQAFRYGGGPNALPLTDPHNVGTFSADAGEETKRYVDFAAEYGQLAVLRVEHLGQDGMSEAAFLDVLEHVEASGAEVVTASELREGTRV